MASLYGGFECDFVIPPPERLRCAICLRVLRDPQLTTCGHHFCTTCITKANQESQVCPVCRKTYSLFQDEKIPREVRELKVRCSNKKLGCEWVGELGQMVKHQDFLCPLRKYNCDYCRNYASTYTDVAINHWPKCEFFPVPCPNDCPKGSIPRNYLLEHIKNECKVRKEAKQIPELQKELCHLQEKAAEATSPKSSLLDKVELLEEKLNKTETRVKELEEQVGNMKNRLEELQRDDNDEDLTQSLNTPEAVGNMKNGLEELQRDDNDGGHHSSDTQASSSLRFNLRRRSASEPDEGKKNQEEDLTQSLTIPKAAKANLLHDPNVYLEWSPCDDLPETMVDGYAVLVGGFVYVGGGSCTSGDAVYKYSYMNNNWSTLPKANRQKFAMVCYKKQLVLIGGKGLNAEYYGSLLVWDEKLHMWTDSVYPPMNNARMMTAACSHEERIIVAGGKSGRFSTLDSVEVFDGEEWLDAAQLPTKIYSAKTAVFENELFIMGGEGQKKAVYCVSLESLNGDTQKWESIPDTEFQYASIAAFGNTLLAIGGSTPMGSTSAVRAYFTGRKTWLRLDKPLPRTFCCTAVVVISPEELLLIGGCSGTIKYKHVFKGMLKYSSSS